MKAINETELAPEKDMADYIEKLFCAGIVISGIVIAAIK